MLTVLFHHLFLYHPFSSLFFHTDTPHAWLTLSIFVRLELPRRKETARQRNDTAISVSVAPAFFILHISFFLPYQCLYFLLNLSSSFVFLPLVFFYQRFLFNYFYAIKMPQDPGRYKKEICNSLFSRQFQ